MWCFKTKTRQQCVIFITDVWELDVILVYLYFANDVVVSVDQISTCQQIP